MLLNVTIWKGNEKVVSLLIFIDLYVFIVFWLTLILR